MRLIDADALVNVLMTYTWRDEDERLIDDADEKREYIKQWLPDLPTVSGWISVKDKLPDIRGCYLVYRPNFHAIYPLWQATVCYWDGNVWYDNYEATEGLELHFSITHWMPLPEPPKEED